LASKELAIEIWAKAKSIRNLILFATLRPIESLRELAISHSRFKTIGRVNLQILNSKPGFQF
jgi:hypothetical protein